MGRLITQRLLLAIPTLLFISLLTFCMGYFAPGDPVRIIAGEKADDAAIERVRQQYGLDQPPHIQYLRFLTNALRLDFGISYYNQRPIGQIVREGILPTATLALCAILLASTLGMTLGFLAAWYQGRAVDKISVVVSLLGITVPNFVLAPLLVYLFAVQLRWFPVAGWGQWIYIVLPAVVLAARPTAFIARLARTSASETLGQEFIRTAYAKGLSGFQVFKGHVFRNAMLVVLTGIGNSFGFLLTGSFIVETAFGIPGLGYKSVQAVLQRDYPVIQATTLLFAFLFVMINLLLDLTYSWLDPRIKVQGRTS